MIEIILLTAGFALAAYIAYTDYRYFKITNIPLGILFILGWVYTFLGSHSPEDALYGTLLGFGIGFIMFAFGGIGGGDAKMLAAIGVWTGWYGLYIVLLASLIIGAVWGIIKLFKQKILLERMKTFFSSLFFKYVYGVKGMAVFKKPQTEDEIKKDAVPWGSCLAVVYVATMILERVDILA